MKLNIQETIMECLPIDPANEKPRCHDCNKLAYRNVVISFGGVFQSVPLCGGHFIDAWAEYPELRRLDALLGSTANAA
jgi:hypothetical protein